MSTWSGLQFGENYVYNEATGKVWTDAWAFLFAKGDMSKPLAIGQLSEGGKKQMMKSMEKSTLRGLVSKKPKEFKATVGKNSINLSLESNQVMPFTSSKK